MMLFSQPIGLRVFARKRHEFSGIRSGMMMIEVGKEMCQLERE